MSRSSPCIGICSTTYGDLVCRGCHRFAHEIVQWNGYSPDQRTAVWQRLLNLRATTVPQYLELIDEQQLHKALDEDPSANATTNSTGPEHAVDPMRLLAALRTAARQQVSLAEVGLAAKVDETNPMVLLRSIDNESYQRACAHYERSFKVPAR